MPAKKKAVKKAATVPEGPIKPHKDYAISRIEQEAKSNKGYYVRMTGLPYKWFADKSHGGKKKALEAAIEHRNAEFLKLSPKRQLRGSKAYKYAAKN